jgi:sterol desaturase/sphingolipid hydroxylase (fatty acid hydroxylase superfamily)
MEPLQTEILQPVAHYLRPFAVDFLPLAAWLLLLMAIFAPLERLFPLHPQKVLRKAFVTDLGYYFLNSLLPKLLLIPPLTMIAWVANYFVPGGLHSWVAGMPPCTRFAAAMIVGEIGFYWGHRWMHEIPLLWRFHSIHHSAEQIDWLVSTRAHPLDMVFTRLCGFIPMYALGLAQPMGNRVDLVPLLIVLVGTLWGFFIHANLRWRFGWLEWLVSTPAFHHWHHVNVGNISKNYAPMLPWVDKLFGTCYMPKKQWPTKYGIDGPISPTLAGQLLQPFAYPTTA